MDSLRDAREACMIYVTVGSDAEARAIARALVTEKLVACANILGPATSLYRWQGQIEEAQELVMICKTTRDRVAAASARVKSLHTYETPCITVYAMAEADPRFLGWIETETRAREA